MEPREGHEGRQRQRGVEQVRPAEAVRRGVRRAGLAAAAARVERPDTARGRQAVVEPPRRRPEAVGECEEDAGGGAGGEEEGGEGAVEPVAAAVVAQQRREDGEGEDGGGGEEDVEARRTAEDEVEDVDELAVGAPIFLLVIIVGAPAVAAAGGLDEHLTRVILIHKIDKGNAFKPDSDPNQTGFTPFSSSNQESNELATLLDQNY